jgi:hypothetical protein
MVPAENAPSERTTTMTPRWKSNNFGNSDAIGITVAFRTFAKGTHKR